MDDLQRQPKDDDRDFVVARINRAHDEGRIGAADRDIRLGNVRSAQSMAELDLMSRELDQLDAVLSPSSTATPVTPTATAFGRFEPPRRGGDTGQAVSVSGRVLAIIFAVILAIALVVAGVVYAGSRDNQSGQAAPGEEPGIGQATEEPASPDEEDPDVTHLHPPARSTP